MGPTCRSRHGGRALGQRRKQGAHAQEAIAEYRVKVAVNMKGAADYAYRFDEFEALPFASKTVNTVTPFDLAAWRDEQMPRLKPGTVVRKLALLSGVLTWCVKERGWMTVNPLSLVRKPRVADGRNRTLSPEELKYLMLAASTSKAAWLSAALTVLMNSAMRRSELFGLKRQDVDAGTSTARLHDTKNGSARDVPLCPRSLAALHELDVAAQVSVSFQAVTFKLSIGTTDPFIMSPQQCWPVIDRGFPAMRLMGAHFRSHRLLCRW